MCFYKKETHTHTPTHTNTHQHTPTQTNTHQHTPTHTPTHTPHTHHTHTHTTHTHTPHTTHTHTTHTHTHQQMCRTISSGYFSFPMALFPECIAKGSRFTFEGPGVDTCSRDPASGVRNRPQLSAHDRRQGKVAVPMGKVTKTCLS